ncbi:MAG TPA: DUF308 domain-containing protein [Methylomirabilota bacterium]|nr:DUF308 domain-containing protein [Methylomirabilota bacterium]
MIKLATPEDLLLLALVRNWWMVALRGALAVLFGAFLLATAPTSLDVLIAIFGLYALLDGAWAIASALWVTRTWVTPWPILFEGTASVAVGAFALGWPWIPRELVFAIATWGVVTGAMELIAAARLTGPAAARWLLTTAGVCSLFLAGLIVAIPLAETARTVRTLGVYAIVFGISLSAAARVFRKTVRPQVGGG